MLNLRNGATAEQLSKYNERKAKHERRRKRLKKIRDYEARKKYEAEGRKKKLKYEK